MVELELAPYTTTLELASGDTMLELDDRETLETNQPREMELVIDG